MLSCDVCVPKVRQLLGSSSSQGELSSSVGPSVIHLVLSYSTPDGSVRTTSALIAGQVGSKSALLLARYQVSLLPTSLTGPAQMLHSCPLFMISDLKTDFSSKTQWCVRHSSSARPLVRPPRKANSAAWLTHGHGSTLGQHPSRREHATVLVGVLCALNGTQHQ